MDDREYEPIPVLSEEEEEGGTAERIKKVIPYFTRELHKFVRTLRPRERSLFNIPDILQELWVVLLEKDVYFDPEKSKYITYSVNIFKQQINEIRNRSHIVQAPRDTAKILREGEESSRYAETVTAIAEVGSLTTTAADASGRHDESAADRAGNRDEGANAKRILNLHLGCLSKDELKALRWKWGLLGSSPLSEEQIATMLGVTPKAVSRTLAAAERKLLLELQGSGVVYT